MKMSTYLALMFLSVLTVPGTACDSPLLAKEEASSPAPGKDQSPITCQFAGDELANRTSEVLQVLAQYEEVREHEDGFSLRFPGNDVWAERLINFVRSERNCCSFFKFELTFEPDFGPIWLYIGGSLELKGFIVEMLG